MSTVPFTSNLTKEARRYGEVNYGQTQSSVGDVHTADGHQLKAQFDTGATGTFIKEETAKRLKLPVVRRERRTIKTLNKREVVPCNIYRLTLTDTNGIKKTLKLVGLEDCGDNPTIPAEIRKQLAAYYDIPLIEVANPEGEIDLIIGQRNAAELPTVQLQYGPPPANCPDIQVLRSPLVSGLMFMGVTGIDPERDISKSIMDFNKFIETESEPGPIPCSDCQRIKCKACKYESSALSIQQRAELDEILKNVEIIPNPERPGKFMFLVQYVWHKIDIFEQFNSSRTNYRQVLKSTLDLRKRLLKMGKLSEFDNLIKEEVASGFMKPLNEEDEHRFSSLPECFNRLNLVFKDSSETTKTRIVNDNSTYHANGMSANMAQVKGETSINKVNHVLWNFFINPVPLVLDISKAYRSIRTKTLTNVLRKFIWFDNPDDPNSIRTYILTRVAYGDKIADKFVEQICRHILARDCEEFGEMGERCARMLRNERYLDDTDTSLRTKIEKDKAVEILSRVFDRYSLSAKHFITSKEFCDPEEFTQLATTNEGFTETILGIKWNYESDSFVPELNLNTHKKVRNKYMGPGLDQIDLEQLVVTKRVTARVVAQQFDATGKALQPSIIRGKILYSRICKLGTSWDEPLPHDIQAEVKKYFKELITLMQEIKPFPRGMLKLDATLKAVIGLRDGSATGFGCIVYFVCELPNGERYSRIAGAKSRITSQTMNTAEAMAMPLCLNLIADMFKHMHELQQASDVKVISAGDSESISFSYNPARVEKNVLVRNAMMESLRAAQRIISFNENANIYFSFVEGLKNSSDYVSKAHNHLADKINSPFYRNGHEEYLSPDFGIDSSFFHINKDKEEYKSLREPPLEKELVSKVETKAEPNHYGHLYEIMSKFNNLESLIDALLKVKKVALRKSFKIGLCADRRGWSWNDRLLKAQIFRDIIKLSQTHYPPAKIKMMQPICVEGIMVTRNRMSIPTHMRYFGNRELPIVSSNDKELVRLSFNSAHVIKTFAQPAAEAGTAGVIHLSQYLTRTRMKRGPYGMHIPNNRDFVSREVRKCTTCRKENSQTLETFEGNKFILDNWDRSKGLYSVIGIDLIGPFKWTKNYNLRRSTPEKLFVLVIVEMITGAISFQLLADYSTSAFICGLQTHIARTTTPDLIVCDAGSQLRAAARISEEESLTAENDAISKAQKCFKKTTFVVAPTESQWYNGSTEVLIRESKRMLRNYFSLIKKQTFPTTAVFPLENLLTTVANLLNQRPIFKSTEYMVCANDLIKPYTNQKADDVIKLHDSVLDKYKEFCKIFETEVVAGVMTKANKPRNTTETIQPGTFVMIKYPSKIGFYKYGIIQSQASESSHKYCVQMIGRRTKKGSGKPELKTIPLQNIVVLSS